jgi:hypothetical protein
MMDVLRTAVSKLINPYISGTLFAVFRNPPFSEHVLGECPLCEEPCLLLPSDEPERHPDSLV